MNITRFRINGRAHTAKINNLIHKGFNPRNISNENKILIFDELSVNELSIVAFLDEMCYDYSIINRQGTRHTINNIVSDRGLFIGIIISILLLIFCSLLIFDIDVIGAKNTDINLVNTAISSSGIKRFGMIYRIDKEALSENILKLDGISSVAIETKGVKLFIYIEEELPKASIEDYDTVTPILSSYDAIVTRVITLSGTALVHKDTTVKKGQTLIAPYMDKGSVEEENEERTPIAANGIVYGRVWYHESVSISKEEIIQKRTGNYIDVVTPTYIVKGSSNLKIPYALYEIEENINYFNAFFPLIVTYTRYYELIEEKVVHEVSGEYNSIISSSYVKLCNQIPIGAVILRQWSNIKEVDNITIIDVYLETEQRIDDGGNFGEDHH